METYTLGAMESRFADVIWEHAPVTTAELVRLCGEAFDWKRTTTYTMLKRLCQRGLFRLDNGLVTVLVSREAFLAARSESFVDESFGGSLPAFIAAFTRSRPLSNQEAEAIQRLIDDSRRGGDPSC